MMRHLTLLTVLLAGSAPWLAGKKPAPESPAREIERRERECVKGKRQVCDELGRDYLEGAVVSRDGAKAAQFLDRACAAGSGESCRRLAGLLVRGEGAPKDVTRALTLLERACKDTPGEACADLGRLHSGGQALPQDDERAFQLYERGCTRSGTACVELGKAYAAGRGVERDAGRGRAVWEEACRRDLPDACAFLVESSAAARERGPGSTREAAPSAATSAPQSAGPATDRCSKYRLQPDDACYDTPPEVVQRTPLTPPRGLGRRVKATSSLHVVVGADGYVARVRVVRSDRSDPRVDAAAIRCVRDWVYTPARREGRPIESVTLVTFSVTERNAHP
jgi:TonB family protein